jgi:hypothetical protein
LGFVGGGLEGLDFLVEFREHLVWSWELCVPQEMLGGEDSLAFEKRKWNDTPWKTKEKERRVMSKEDLLVQWISKIILLPLELWKVFDHFKIVFVSCAKYDAVNVFENLDFLVVHDMNAICLNFTYFSQNFMNIVLSSIRILPFQVAMLSRYQIQIIAALTEL